MIDKLRKINKLHQVKIALLLTIFRENFGDHFFHACQIAKKLSLNLMLLALELKH